MRESVLMFLQYLTGLLVVVFGSFHFLLISALAPSQNKGLYVYLPGTHTLIGGALSYTTVHQIYTSLLWGSIFELLLTFLVFHVFNGFRIVLSEQFAGPRSERIISYSLLVIGLAIFIYGSRTIVLMLAGGVF